MVIKIYGDVTKPKMLTLHPMLADGESMMRIMEHFLGDYCVIAPDFSGQGSDSGTFVDSKSEANTLAEYLISNNCTDIELLFAASLGASVGFELLAGNDMNIKTVVFEGAPMFEKTPGIITACIRSVFLKKQRKARANPGISEKRMTEIYGSVFGPSMGKSFERMSEQSLINILNACSRCPYPVLSESMQKHLFFEYGSKDKDSKAIKIIKKHYPYATVTLRQGYGHCEYLSSHCGEYGNLLEEYMNHDSDGR
ncbi:MAG: hypothetical protein ACI4SF_01370 [Oscillospiraceae bacterium]